MKRIKLTQGKYAIVDDEDYPYLNRFNWFASLKRGRYYPVAGFESVKGGRKYGNKKVSLISFLIRKNSNQDIGYKNKNPLDCRKNNLILVHTSQTIHRGPKRRSHKGRPCTSEYRGVCWNKRKGMWCMQIKSFDKRIASYHKSEKDAAKAYNKNARELYGEFAYQNKI